MKIVRIPYNFILILIRIPLQAPFIHVDVERKTFRPMGAGVGGIYRGAEPK